MEVAPTACAEDCQGVSWENLEKMNGKLGKNLRETMGNHAFFYFPLTYEGCQPRFVPYTNPNECFQHIPS
jgi:hypothetical protein